MIKLMLGLVVACISTTAVSQVEDFDFRSGYRPQYDQSISVSELAALQAEDDILVLDIRLPEDFDTDPQLIPGAEYMSPEELPVWAEQIDKSKEVVVYCVAGKWVSHKVAYLLNQSGVNISVLEGGIEAWKVIDTSD